MTTIFSIAASKVQSALQQLSSNDAPAASPPLLLPAASDMAEFKRITSVARQPTEEIGDLEFYPAGTPITDVREDVETHFAPPVDISTHETPEALNARYATAMRTDFTKFIERIPLLYKAAQALAHFTATKENGEPPPPEAYLVISLNTATTYTVKPNEVESGSKTKIFIPTNDINQMSLAGACEDLFAGLRAKTITLDEARTEILKRQKEIVDYNVDAIKGRADETAAQLEKLVIQRQWLTQQKESAVLSDTVRTAATAPSMPMGMHPNYKELMANEKRQKEKLDVFGRQISEMDSKISLVEKTLTGFAGAIVLQTSMLNLSHGKTEDDVLAEAGTIMDSFGLTSQAHEYFVQARDVASDLHDTLSVMEHQVDVINTDKSLTKEQKINAYLAHIGATETNLASYMNGPAIDLDGSPLQVINKKLLTDTRKFTIEAYKICKARAISEAVSLAADTAEKDPENDDFVKTQKLLTIEIDDAQNDPDLSGQRFIHLTVGATTRTKPYIIAASEQKESLQLKKSKELIAGAIETAGPIQSLYAHLLQVAPKEEISSTVTEAYGQFGAHIYYYTYQNGGYPYEGLKNTFGSYANGYPDSRAKSMLLSYLRTESPHLFNENGDLLPEGERPVAKDAEYVRSEISKLHITPGTFVQKLGYDLPLTTAIPYAFAKCGAIVGSAFSPAGTAVGAAAGGTIGVVAALTEGAALLRFIYKGEIKTLQHQAEMVGARPAGLKPGEGDKAVAEAALYFGIGVLFSPGISRASQKLMRSFETGLGRRINAAGRAYYAQEIGRETTQARRWLPAPGNAVKGFLNIWKKPGDDPALLFLAEKMSQLLGLGQREAKESTEEVVQALVRQARASLEESASMVTDPDFARQFANRVVSGAGGVADDAGRWIRLEALLGQAENNKIGQAKFARRFADIYGLSKENDEEVAKMCRFVFNGGHTRLPGVNAGRLRSAMRGVGTDSGPLVETLAGSLNREGALALRTELREAVGIADVPKLLNLARMFKTEGTRVLQLERIYKTLVRDEKLGRDLLEKMLTSPTNEEVLVAGGKKIDQHVISGLITNGERNKIHSTLRTLLRQTFARNPLYTEEFFNNLKDVDAVAVLVRRVRNSLNANMSTDAGRRQVIKAIVDDEVLCREFVEQVLGKGLNPVKVAKNPAHKAIKKTLLETLVKSEKEASTDGSVAISVKEEPLALRNFQHAQKDFLRRVARTWRTTPLSDVADTVARDKYTDYRRALSEAITMADENGEQFANKIFDELAPWQKDDFGKFLPQAIARSRGETRKTLASQFLNAMKYSPEKGFLDPLARLANKTADGVLSTRAVDRWWTRRIENSVRAIVAGEPGLSYRSNTMAWRKVLLRSVHLEKKAAANRVIGNVAPLVGGSEKEPGLLTKAFLKSYDFVSKRIATEEVRRAHRICVPVFASDLVISKLRGTHMGELGMICGMLGSNYYLQKWRQAATYGLDITALQKVVQIADSKDDADSKDLIDVQRIWASYLITIATMKLQGFGNQGLQFAQKSLIDKMIGNLPGLRRLPLAMNGAPFFNFYSGSVQSPSYLTGMGIWGGVKGLALGTFVSAGQSMGMAYISKGDALMKADTHVVGQTGFYYLQNGAVNVIGFNVNKYLERGKAFTDLTSAPRQFVERVLGLNTYHSSIKVFDIYAGKGEFRKKMDGLLDDAVKGDLLAKREALDIFKRRFVIDIVGWWDRVVDQDRTLGVHLMEPSVNQRQMDEWYSSYLPEQAVKDPKRVSALLEAFEDDLDSPSANWKTAYWGYTRTRESTALYYLSVFVKSYANAYEENPETYAHYKPFRVVIDRSQYREYWATVPRCRDLKEVRKAIILMADKGLVDEAGSLAGTSLDELMSLVRSKRLFNKPASEFKDFPFSTPDNPDSHDEPSPE